MELPCNGVASIEAKLDCLAANSSLKYISALFVAYCITTGLMTTFLIVHTVTMIRRIPNQSKRAQDNIQRATVILFIQFGIFIVFLLVPVAIFNSQVLKVFEQMGAYPFLIAVVFFFSHGLFISIISIAMSKDHRLSIVIFLRPKENQITVLSPPSTDSPSRRRSSSKFWVEVRRHVDDSVWRRGASGEQQ
ncbi:hypothetical protein PRIPAC_78956, partial [Pristionchus pacificus]|uniref:G protein-coupled receptor n=1 Tax=Pristionchus pacificus TaxID=54126 RepID=A0A2A6BXG8_PRIPA